MNLGGIGVWTSYRAFGIERAGAAAKLAEQLGYGAWWVGGSPQVDGGWDRLIDAVLPHGGAEEIAEVVRAHLEAGADHVCLQPLGEEASRASPGRRSRGP